MDYIKIIIPLVVSCILLAGLTGEFGESYEKFSLIVVGILAFLTFIYWVVKELPLIIKDFKNLRNKED